MEHDEIFRNVTRLPPDIRARERYFLGNTLRGMIEYVDGQVMGPKDHTVR
jgi:hypothetical protein